MNLTKPNETPSRRPRSRLIAEKLDQLDSPATVKLLVSLRNPAEISSAIKAEIDLLDLKEPRNGPLAPVDPRLWQQSARDFDSQLKLDGTPLLSAALGETADARRLADQVPSAFAFAKVGPSGCSDPASLNQLWDEIRCRLDDDIQLVAVAYADFGAADCLAPEQVFQQAAKAGLRRCLVDTFRKDGRSTLDHMGDHRLRQLSAQAIESGIWWTLAGSIKMDHLPHLQSAQIRPNCIGVRGDVCVGSRTGTVNGDRVIAWRKALDQFSRTTIGP